MYHGVAGKKKLRHMKCVMQVIESIVNIERIYNGREGCDLAYTTLLWEKRGYKKGDE